MVILLAIVQESLGERFNQYCWFTLINGKGNTYTSVGLWRQKYVKGRSMRGYGVLTLLPHIYKDPEYFICLS